MKGFLRLETQKYKCPLYYLNNLNILHFRHSLAAFHVIDVILLSQDLKSVTRRWRH